MPSAAAAYNRGMRVRVAILTVCLGLLTGCTMWRQHSNPGWSSATSGEQFVSLWWADIKAKRIAELGRHMATTYLGTSPTGVFDRAAALQRFSQLELEDYTLGDFVTQANGADLVVTYRAAFNGTLAGQPIQMSARVLSVWQQTKSGWVLVAESVTPDETKP